MEESISSIKRALIIPDTHRPFHDRKAYDLMIEIAVHAGIDEVVILGDYADFYSVSRHRKDPRVGALLVDEVESVRQGLDEIDRLFPSAKKVFLEGNHEIRLENFLIEHAPALFGVTEISFLFELNKRPHWTLIPFGRNQSYDVLGSSLLAFHRPRASTPRLHLQRTAVSSVYGDIHKIERAHQVGLDNRHYTCFCPGWLGDVRSRVFDYMPTVPQWQLGFAIVSVEDSSKQFHIEIAEIKDYSTIVHGKFFKA